MGRNCKGEKKVGGEGSPLNTCWMFLNDQFEKAFSLKRKNTFILTSTTNSLCNWQSVSHKIANLYLKRQKISIKKKQTESIFKKKKRW